MTGARPAPADAMVVYGHHAVREVLRGRRTAGVGELLATAGAARQAWLSGRQVRVVSAEELELACGSPAHQGICARVGPYPYVSADELLGAQEPLLLALDQVQDPQNLGAICRSAECAGATGVVITERRAAEVTAAVCRASAGAVEHLAIARVRNLADFLADAKGASCWCYGADPDGAREYTEPDYRGGLVLVLGGEGRGLRPRVAAACDELVAIPQRGRIESLNVSAATAVLLYGALHGRKST